MVSYSELPESERDYDRITAEQTLRATLKLGYRIEDPPQQHFLERYASKARTVWDQSGGGARGVRQVMALRAEGFHWGADPKLYCQLTSTALSVGDLVLVYELTNEGLRVTDEPELMLRLARDRALAMAHEGRAEEAEQELLSWLDRCEIGSAERRDIASALGRLSKERCYNEGDVAHLKKAMATSFRRSMWPPCTRCTAIKKAAHTWAAKVLELADDSEWGWASKGEAQLILGDVDKAAEYYQKYQRARLSSPRDIATTRKQAKHLLDALGGDQSWLDKVLPLPSVLVFAGVVPDGESEGEGESNQTRFPAGEENRVRSEIRTALTQIAPVTVYCSAAAGSDLLLLDEASALKIETQIILPASVAEFRRLSVEPFGTDWCQRFDAAIAEASRVEYLGRHFPPESEQALMFRYGNHVLVGSAMLRAKLGGFALAALAALAVWDGQPPRGPGGTGEFVGDWNQRINLAESERMAPARIILPADPPPTGPSHTRHRNTITKPSNCGQEVCAMLFADVKNFSSLTEKLLPQFQKPLHAPDFRTTRHERACTGSGQHLGRRDLHGVRHRACLWRFRAGDERSTQLPERQLA